MPPKDLSHLPAVGKLLHEPRVQAWLQEHPQSLVADALRKAVEKKRSAISDERGDGEVLRKAILNDAEHIIIRTLRPHLQRVINATGIVLHTGLGRAPLSQSALDAIQQSAGGYCSLEIDLDSGKRGKRTAHIGQLLCRLTGAEAATVVNNNAAATLLILKAVTQLRTKTTEATSRKRFRRRNVVVSRGQLVEIGGSYRLPEIMKASGVELREVGTTNRTRISDYEQAIDERTAALMRVHTSNYRITGFQQEAPIAELARLAHQYNLPVIDDLGSGALMDLRAVGFADEPHVPESIAAGADLVCFSGDKLLGGPQAGIILGGKTYIDAIERNPLMRTYRVDKLVLLALDATLRAYLDIEKAQTALPCLRMLLAGEQLVRDRAAKLLEAIRIHAPNERVEIAEDVSYAGGGSLPAEKLKTFIVRWTPPQSISAHEATTRLRQKDTPIIARIHNDAVIFDCRTLADHDLQPIANAIADLSQAL